MKPKSAHTRRLMISLPLLLVALLLVTGGAWSPGSTAASASSPTYSGSMATKLLFQPTSVFDPSAPNATCPAGGQCFADVLPGSTFYTVTNALYIDDVISGYACGGPGEPCDAENRPYYRGTNTVTRAQMSKFVDNGRRNIDNAVGESLVLSGTTYRTLESYTAGSGEAIHGFCLSPSPCYAVAGDGQNTGNYGGVFYGGYAGVYATASDADGTGVLARSTGTGAYAADVSSDVYRSLHVSQDSNYYALFVDTDNLAADFEGAVDIYGNLYVSGTCTGCLLTGMIQNVDGTPLQMGDVVTIVGTSPAVQGENPVITVRKASTSYDRGVAGIVGQALYVPDADTRAAYAAQKEQLKTAQTQRDQILEQAKANGTKPDFSTLDLPETSITDAAGTMHVDETADSVAVGAYGGIVTTGSYKAVKVDASFGAITAGDLLTTSPNPGYAMKVVDVDAASGAIIGKALGNLDSGTGTVPVLVTLK